MLSDPRKEFSRHVSAELVRAFDVLREGEYPDLDPEAFLQGVRDCLANRHELVQALRECLGADLPRYTSEPEPESDLSRALFPRAHGGNVRRLVATTYWSEEGRALTPSTRAYVILRVMILNHLSPWQGRNFKPFVDYLREELHITDALDNGLVHRYWRRLPLSGWGWAKARKDAPRNAGEVMRFAHYVHRCICSGGTKPDERLRRAEK